MIPIGKTKLTNEKGPLNFVWDAYVNWVLLFISFKFSQLIIFPSTSHEFHQTFQNTTIIIDAIVPLDIWNWEIGKWIPAKFSATKPMEKKGKTNRKKKAKKDNFHIRWVGPSTVIDEPTPFMHVGLVCPIMAYTGRLRPKGVPFSLFRYMRG